MPLKIASHSPRQGWDGEEKMPEVKPPVFNRTPSLAAAKHRATVQGSCDRVAVVLRPCVSVTMVGRKDGAGNLQGFPHQGGSVMVSPGLKRGEDESEWDAGGSWAREGTLSPS